MWWWYISMSIYLFRYVNKGIELRQLSDKEQGLKNKSRLTSNRQRNSCWSIKLHVENADIVNK